MAGHGGRRAGAGRLPKLASVRQGGAVQTAADALQSRIENSAEMQAFIAAREGEYLRALDDLATGIFVEEVTEDGKRRVYRRAPDRRAAEFLITMQHGKPVGRQEVKRDTTITLVANHIPRPAMKGLAAGDILIEAEAKEDEE